MNQDKVAALRQVFPEMEDEYLTALAEIAEWHTYPADTVLCQEGATEDTFYVITSGDTEVVKQLDGGVEKVLNRHSGGDFVGEIALVRDVTRTATVRTIAPTTTLEIAREDFLRLLYTSAPLAVHVMNQLVNRMLATDEAIIAHLRQQNADLQAAYDELKARCGEQ